MGHDEARNTMVPTSFYLLEHTHHGSIEFQWPGLDGFEGGYMDYNRTVDDTHWLIQLRTEYESKTYRDYYEFKTHPTLEKHTEAQFIFVLSCASSWLANLHTDHYLPLERIVEDMIQELDEDHLCWLEKRGLIAERINVVNDKEPWGNSFEEYEKKVKGR